MKILENPRTKLGISEYFSRTRNLEYDSLFLVVLGKIIPMILSGDPKHLPQDLIFYPFSGFPISPSLRGVPSLRTLESSKGRGNPFRTSVFARSPRRSNPGFLKKSSNYRVFPLSRPGAEHPGPPQDFLGRKSFAETEGENRSFSSLRGVREGSSGTPAHYPHCRPRKNYSYDFIRGPRTESEISELSL